MVQEIIHSRNLVDSQQSLSQQHRSPYPPRHFLSLLDWSTSTLMSLLTAAIDLKQQSLAGHSPPLLHRKTLAMIFERPSLRTRVSFEMAMQQLGGTALYIRESEVGFGQREAIADIAPALGQYVDAVLVRMSSYDQLLEYARYSPIPVINGLTTYNHPCQAVADAMTIYEEFGQLAGIKVAYLGASDSDVARSLLFAAAQFEFQLIISSPPEYCIDQDSIHKAVAIGGDRVVQIIPDPIEAVRQAQVIYTDNWDGGGTWDSLPAAELVKQIQLLAPYQVNDALVAYAPSEAIVMHCMPTMRDQEITSAIVEGPRARLLPQAANRLHFQKALLVQLLTDSDRH